MGENSFSALGDRYYGGWVLQGFSTYSPGTDKNVVYQLTVSVKYKVYPLMEEVS
jgi:hypothetical protein